MFLGKDYIHQGGPVAWDKRSSCAPTLLDVHTLGKVAGGLNSGYSNCLVLQRKKSLQGFPSQSSKVPSFENHDDEPLLLQTNEDRLRKNVMIFWMT